MSSASCKSGRRVCNSVESALRPQCSISAVLSDIRWLSLCQSEMGCSGWLKVAAVFSWVWSGEQLSTHLFIGHLGPAAAGMQLLRWLGYRLSGQLEERLWGHFLLAGSSRNLGGRQQSTPGLPSMWGFYGSCCIRCCVYGHIHLYSVPPNDSEDFRKYLLTS